MRLALLALSIMLCEAGPATAQARRIEFADMLFADKDFGAKFKRLHAAAEKMAGPKWERLPFESRGEYKGRGIYYGEWCSFREDDTTGPLNYNGPNELRFVQLGAASSSTRRTPSTCARSSGCTCIHVGSRPTSAGTRSSSTAPTTASPTPPRPPIRRPSASAGISIRRPSTKPGRRRWSCT